MSEQPSPPPLDVDFDAEVPLHEFLGLPAELPTTDAVRLEVPLEPRLRGIALPVHGGVVSALVDVACGLVAGTEELIQQGGVPATTEMHVRYFGQPRTGPLVVEASATRRGRRLISVDCVVSDGGGREIARASASYLVLAIADVFPGAGEPAAGPA